MPKKKSIGLLTTAVIAITSIAALATWIIQSDAIDIIGMDMNVAYSIQRILLGRPVYESPATVPYSITQYSPLYYYAVALPATVVHVAASDIRAIASIARTVSTLIAVALVSLCLAFTERRLRSSRETAIVAAAFIAAATSPWYFTIRPDALATLFTLMSFYIISAESPRNRDVILAALCGIAAILSKQTGVFAPITIAAFLSFDRRWKDLRLFGLIVILTAGAILAGLSLSGLPVRANIIDGINNGVAWRPALLLAYRPVFYWFAPLIALGFAAMPVLLKREASAPEKLIGIALAISFPMSVLTALKRGSAENYFNEFIVLCVFAFVAVYVKRVQSPDERILFALKAYLAAFLIVRTGHDVYTTYLYHRRSPETRVTSQIPPVDYVRRHIAPGYYALGFAVGLSNVFPERMIMPEKDLADAAMRRGLVDYANFRELSASGKIQYVVMPNSKKPSPFLGVRFDQFRPIRRFQFYTVYESKRNWTLR